MNPLVKSYKLLLFFVGLISSVTVAQNKDSLESRAIEEVKIIKNTNVVLKQKNDRYIVDVMGTDFQVQTDSWEALRTIPILKVQENSGISVFNKKVRVEINGVLMQISAIELEDYLKSINPKDIKTIEIISVPNASYPSDVEAVINIVLYSRIDSYRFGLSSNTGFRKKFFTAPGLNGALNYKKFRGYVNYAYSFSQPVTSSDIAYDIGNGKVSLRSENARKYFSHTIISNLQWDLSEKSKVVLIQDLSLSDSDNTIDQHNTGEKLEMETTRKTLRFSQLFHHNFNEENKIKLGAQQILPVTDFQNVSLDQRVETETPIFNYFIDYTNSNKLGETLLGFKATSIESNNLNYNSNTLNLFNYNEKTLASYLNQSVQLGDNQNVSLGIRYESTFTEAATETGTLVERRFENLLYNIAYTNVNQKKQTGNTIYFKKAIQRPNYRYLNRYTVNNDVIGFIGDEDIKPTKFHSVGYEQFIKQLFFTTQFVYAQDFLSTFYTSNGNVILNTYKNFSNAFVGTIGGGYRKDVFKFWNLNLSSDLTYFKLKDEDYTTILQKSTPRLILDINNKLTINKSTWVNVNYAYVSNYNDGLIKHYSTDKLNLILTKRFKNFDAILYYYDVFKGMAEKELVNNSLLYVNSNTYKDNRVLGVSLRWNLVSKNFKNQKTEEIKDETIDRL